MITITPDEYVYRVAYAISKTKHFFSQRIITFLGLEKSKFMMKRMYKLFATYYFDSLMIYPSGGLEPINFAFAMSDMKYLCSTYGIDKTVTNCELQEFIDNVYGYFTHCIKRNITIPKISVTNGVVTMERDTSSIRLFKLAKNQINLLFQRYTGKAFDRDVINLLLIYSSISSVNNHLSVPPNLLETFNIHTELFGTPLNTSLPSFCSPFEMIERNFGSQGSFFTHVLQDGGNYTFNPPYVDTLMFEASKRLESQLTGIKNYFIMGVLPAWETKFRGLEVLQRIPTFKGYVKLDDKEFPYYDYYSEAFVPASETYLFIITDRESHPTFDDIKSEWSKESSERIK